VRVLLITPSMSVRMGGSITSVTMLAKLLSRDHQVEVWTTDHEADHWDPTLSDTCRVRAFQLVFERFFVAPGMLPPLLREMSGFDVVNVFHFWTMTGLLGGLLEPFQQVPVFIHTQGILLPVALNHHGRRKRLAHFWGGCWLLNRFHGAIACNAVEVQFIRQWGFRNAIYVLPNAVMPVAVERGVMRRRLGVPEDTRIVAYLNRFDPIKRVVDLCRAFRMIQTRCDKTVFLLAGDASTPHGLKVQAYAKEVGLRARFLGHLGPEEKWNLLADVDVLCQYSAQEGHSNALTEALAAGVPVVASRGCNFDEIGTEGAGFNVDSIEDMANATTRLLEDDGLRRQMSVNALQLGQNYTVEATSARYLQIYNECRSARGPAAGATPVRTESGS
jgi:glycosyltransferase involved in cell wall biosynthesis